jgi:hypothetical protein
MHDEPCRYTLIEINSAQTTRLPIWSATARLGNLTFAVGRKRTVRAPVAQVKKWDITTFLVLWRFFFSPLHKYFGLITQSIECVMRIN